MHAKLSACCSLSDDASLCSVPCCRSVLRSRQSSWDGTGLNEASSADNAENPANILIDYNKLCDDIYITDWI